jgi:ornithine cyclodeaminase
MSAPLWIREAEVASLLDIGEAIEALETGLRAEARGEARNMIKTQIGWEGATLHALGAAFPAAGFAGTKTWTHTQGGATPLLVLFDSGTGALRAIIEAFCLGQLRTGAASGVATRWLAAPGADEMAVIGTGRQALPQVAAVAAVRRLRRVRVFGRDPERRAEFVRRVGDELGLAAEAAPSVADAVRGTPIVTTVTRATEPFLGAADVARGAHVNAVGAINPAVAEIGADLVARCHRIVADSVPQARELSRELRNGLGAVGPAWNRVQPLSALVAAGRARHPEEDVTLFKALGTGIADLSLGTEVFQRAQQRGLGLPLAAPERAAPRLRPRRAEEETHGGTKRI